MAGVRRHHLRRQVQGHLLLQFDGDSRQRQARGPRGRSSGEAAGGLLPEEVQGRLAQARCGEGLPDGGGERVRREPGLQVAVQELLELARGQLRVELRSSRLPLLQDRQVRSERSRGEDLGKQGPQGPERNGRQKVEENQGGGQAPRRRQGRHSRFGEVRALLVRGGLRAHDAAVRPQVFRQRVLRVFSSQGQAPEHQGRERGSGGGQRGDRQHQEDPRAAAGKELRPQNRLRRAPVRQGGLGGRPGQGR